MREVSCRAIDPFFRAVDRKGVPRARLAEGSGYSLPHLQDRHERVEWDTFRAVMANVRAIFDEAEVREIGAVGLRDPGFRSFALIGRTLFSPAGFYRWMLSSGGMGNQMFSNIVPTFREVGRGRFEVRLVVAPGYEPCPDFFHFAAGGFQALPALVGLPEAQVVVVPLERGARFEIAFDDRPTLRGRAFRAITSIFDRKTTATELDDAIHVLEARYAELELARAALERQKALLDIAYRVGHAIWGEREPTAVGAVVARSLVEVAGFGGVELDAAGADRQTTAAAHGTPGTGVPLEVDLTTHRLTGRLRVWPGRGPGAADAPQLLELITPTVALALDNAFAYRELATYQHELERLVDVRTQELRQARDDLADTVGQLRDAQTVRERFFGNISHEIRTPLTLVLLAVADVEARAGDALDAQARADLGAIVDSARKLLRLVDELLLLAAGEAAQLRLAPEPTDVAALIGALAASWRLAATSAGIELTLEAPPALRAVVDPVALERVVTNLLSNAVKFTPRGGRIELTLAPQDDALCITVRDTGVGVDDELLPRLFGRFERAQGGGVRGGSGIGLSLVKQLVEAHGGTVGVERVATGGTRFRVVVPIGDLPAASPRPAAAAEATLAPRLRPSDFGVGAAAVASGDILMPPGASAGTILVAEDDPRLATMVARLLHDEYVVIVALDGVTALELAQRHEPHLLVTDVDMPGMDGIELARRFRAISGDSLAPVVIMSALADPGSRLAGLEAGAVDYVVKPFDPRELRARVRAQFRMRALALRLHRAENLSALGTLSAGLAHELRNPANGIVNAVGPLRRLLPAELIRADQPAGQLLDVLAGCAEQVAFVSRHLLGFQRGGALELREVALGDVVHRALVLAQPDLDGVEVRAEHDAAARVLCAPPLLVQVLTNLISNAGQAVGRGGWVRVQGATTGALTTFEVADSGPGVPPALRERVFEPFFTTKGPGEGMGLGLALARDIIHRHHGVLEIRERDGRAVFVLELPAAAAAVAEAAS